MSDNIAQSESILQIIQDIDKKVIALPEFQRDFRWEVEKTYDLFDSLARDIFIGTVIYGKPTFAISCRQLDTRPRKSTGSRTKLTIESYTEQDIKRKVQIENFRLVLDGQQRLTSIYRAVCGMDPVYLVLRQDPTGDTLESLMDPFESFAGEDRTDRISVSVFDAYRMDKEQWRESRIQSRFRETKIAQSHTEWDAPTVDAYFEIYLRSVKLLQNLLKRDKLVAYYLLDMNLDKFCAFFERSNSLGIQLNFTDILAAKLYPTFNLRAQIEEFESQHPELEVNKELLIRSVCYLTSGGSSVDKDYILKHLNADNFNQHWKEICELYSKSLNFLYDNYFIMSQEWMPSENMLLPLMIFFREIGGLDLMSQEQMNFVEFWFWSSIFASARYSGGASNEVIVEDARILTKIAHNEENRDFGYLRKLRSRITDPDDILSYNKKGNSIYKGFLNLVNYGSRGLLDWQNGSRLTFNQLLDDHHIFPKAFIVKSSTYTDDFQAQELIDCVANRTLISKSSNLKIGAKAPSKYLSELSEKNRELVNALKTHLIDDTFLEPESDEMFVDFIQMRASAIFDLVDKHTRQASNSFSNFFPVSGLQESEEKIPVFLEYKGQRFNAEFLVNSQQIEFRGKIYAPTTAAVAAVAEAGGPSRTGSGWTLWKYVDKNDHEQQIDTIRRN